jgi:hypothetical protein
MLFDITNRAVITLLVVAMIFGTMRVVVAVPAPTTVTALPIGLHLSAAGRALPVIIVCRY